MGILEVVPSDTLPTLNARLNRSDRCSFVVFCGALKCQMILVLIELLTESLISIEDQVRLSLSDRSTVAETLGI